MALSIGTRLGPYEILALIGAGGMGEVYKARDTRLDRIVAIKVSKEQFSERFEREARAVAALNHPNICALYDVGPNYLVMEYVEGPNLTGPIPLAEALPIARQIAEALEAAHEKGIVHRDLKPANIKLTADGKVKVLDFGLAKAFDTEPRNPSSDPANSPTLTISATRAGMILGTAGYMSPEQARGLPTDKRADIWAYGVVLYEVLTGREMFSGETVSDALAAVLKTDVDWSALPGETPAPIRRLLRRCLERDRKKRLRDIGDALVEIDEAPETVTAPPQEAHASRWPIAAVVLLALAFLTLATVHFRGSLPLEPATVRFDIPLPEKAIFNRRLAISPDGRRLAFAAIGQDGRSRIWVRALDSAEARPLAGTDNAAFLFWSPDNVFIGYYADGKLKKVLASGGPPQTLCETTQGASAWNRDGIILFGAIPPTGGLSRVSAAGGAPAPLTKADPSRPEMPQSWPVFLPDGKHFLYFGGSLQSDVGSIYIAELDSKLEVTGQRRLLGSPHPAVYAPGVNGEKDYLLFLRETTLMAQAFDAKRLELGGEAFPAVEQVGSYRQGGFFGVSANRTLVYRSGSGGEARLEWFDKEGKSLGVAGPASRLSGPALSPDGKQVAVDRTDSQSGGNQDIWLMDQARKTSTRFTFHLAPESNPVWSPDGVWVAFASERDGAANIYRKRANNEGAEEGLLKSSVAQYPTDWSRDGRYLLYSAMDPKTRNDIWVLPMEGDRKPTPYLRGPFDETQGQFSPDGRWVAYTSNESGRPQVYVQPFPASGGKWQISTVGGMHPKWRGDGKELFYVGLDQKLMAVEVKTGTQFEAGIAKALFNVRMVRTTTTMCYTATADGKRFLMNTTRDDESASEPFHVVLNWKPGRP